MNLSKSVLGIWHVEANALSPWYALNLSPTLPRTAKKGRTSLFRTMLSHSAKYSFAHAAEMMMKGVTKLTKVHLGQHPSWNRLVIRSALKDLKFNAQGKYDYATDKRREFPSILTSVNRQMTIINGTLSRGGEIEDRRNLCERGLSKKVFFFFKTRRH